MNSAMYSIGSLKAMEVIDILSGTKLGYIKDLKIDCDASKILALLLPNPKISWFSKNDNIEIPWSQVKKIGIDVILVETDEIINGKE